MASVFVVKRQTKTRGTQYAVRYRAGGREAPLTQDSTWATRRLAEDRKRIVEQQLARGEMPHFDPDDGAAPTVAQVMDAYMQYRTSDLAPSSLRVVKKAAARLGEFGAHQVDDISWQDVHEWALSMHRSGLAPTTVRKYLDQLRIAFDYIELEPNPARSRLIKLPRPKTDELSPPSYDDYIAMYDAISDRYRLALDILEAGGLRVEEAAKLLPGDVDQRNGRIRVSKARTKGRAPKSRWVPLPARLMAKIVDLISSVGRQPNEPVLGITDQGIRNAIARACKRAGIAHYSPHDLRHRCASVRVMAGWPLSTVSEMLGHRKQSITSDTYSHVLTTEPDWLLDQLKAQLRGGPVVSSRYPEGGQNEKRPA